MTRETKKAEQPVSDSESLDEYIGRIEVRASRIAEGALRSAKASVERMKKNGSWVPLKERRTTAAG